jgi:hypothetical protein
MMLKATKKAGCCAEPSKSSLHSVVCHAMMLARPLACSVVIAFLWRYVFFDYKLNLGKSDETALTNMVIPICAMFHSILAAMVLGKVWEEFKVIRHCLLENDRERFQACMHERIPGMIHLLLGTMSMIIISGIMLIEYSNPWSGITAVGAVTFFLVLYWEVATTLDNPIKSPWFVGKIPSEWLIEGQGSETKVPASRTS